MGTSSNVWSLDWRSHSDLLRLQHRRWCPTRFGLVQQIQTQLLPVFIYSFSVINVVMRCQSEMPSSPVWSTRWHVLWPVSLLFQFWVILPCWLIRILNRWFHLVPVWCSSPTRRWSCSYLVPPFGPSSSSWCCWWATSCFTSIAIGF